MTEKNEQAQGSELSDGLDRRICPGCGAENPKSQYRDYFACKCSWEFNGKALPTLRQLMAKPFVCNDVDLGAFLKTLLKAV